MYVCLYKVFVFNCLITFSFHIPTFSHCAPHYNKDVVVIVVALDSLELDIKRSEDMTSTSAAPA